MFYLTKRIDEKQCTVGERCMVLADFCGVLAGHKGTVDSIYDGGVMIAWDPRNAEEEKAIHAGWRRPVTDGFATDELEYLAFETKKHPKVDAEVNRKCACGLHWGHTGKHAPKFV